MVYVRPHRILCDQHIPHNVFFDQISLHGCAGLKGNSRDGILVVPGGPGIVPAAPKPANGFG